MELKDRAVASPSISCSTDEGSAGIGKDKAKQCVAISGAIMPEPLAMPLMVTAMPVDFSRGRRHFHECVGRHDGARRHPAIRPAEAMRQAVPVGTLSAHREAVRR